MWMKSDSGKVCFGAEADVCLGRSGPGELTLDGRVVARVAATPADKSCSAENTGELQYEAEKKTLRVCDGSAWVATGTGDARDADSVSILTAAKMNEFVFSTSHATTGDQSGFGDASFVADEASTFSSTHCFQSKVDSETGWWQVDLLEPHTVKKFALVGWSDSHHPDRFKLLGSHAPAILGWETVYDSGVACPPAAWHLQEGDNGKTWDDVKDEASGFWVSVDKPGAYRYYRISGEHYDVGGAHVCGNGYMILCNVLLFGYKSDPSEAKDAKPYQLLTSATMDKFGFTVSHTISPGNPKFVADESSTHNSWEHCFQMQTGAGDGWLHIDMKADFVVTHFFLVGWTDSHFPNVVRVDGSSDGFIWETVYRSATTCPPDVWHTNDDVTYDVAIAEDSGYWVEITSPGPYSHYRIYGEDFSCSNNHMILCNVPVTVSQSTFTH